MERSIACIARGLVGLGLRAGDRVAFVAQGSSDWDLAHWGVLGARGVVVGADTHLGAQQLGSLLELACPRVLVVDRLDDLAATLPREVCASLRFVVTLHDEAPPPAAGIAQVVALRSLLDDADSQGWDTAQPDDPAWVVFTSGTTGHPKGVVFRHRQIRCAMDAILDAFVDIAPGARLASWLPLSNPFQRIVNLCAAARGAQTYYVNDPREIMKHLPSIRPQVFIGVPRFYEKFHAGATQALGSAGGLSRRIADWALRAGESAAKQGSSGSKRRVRTRLAFALADALVLSRLRAAFGGELRYLISGSAAMPRWLLGRLQAMGLLVLEAYGISECIVPIACNRVGDHRLGTVGKPLKGIEARTAADGELLIRSDGTFDGYLGLPDSVGNRDADGWLATGDLARIDADGFIELVGRKSEVFKTSTGRRVAPQAIEAALRSIPGVEHAAVFGAGRANVLAVLALEPKAEVRLPALADAVRTATQILPAYLRPAGLVVTKRALSVETGDLTGNLKLRRHVVGERYAAALATLAAAVDAPGARSGDGQAFEPGVVDLLVA